MSSPCYHVGEDWLVQIVLENEEEDEGGGEEAEGSARATNADQR